MSNEQLMALADEMAAENDELINYYSDKLRALATPSPQEGEWPDYVMLRDTKLCDDMGGLGQRIFTTAGAGYTKVKYVRADLSAHHSACELGAVRELADQLRGELLHTSPMWEATSYERGRISEKGRCISLLDAIARPQQAALQQRGDSRGGEG